MKLDRKWIGSKFNKHIQVSSYCAGYLWRGRRLIRRKLIPALYDLYIDNLLLTLLIVVFLYNQNSKEAEHDPCIQ
jgi:hypothetical protein